MKWNMIILTAKLAQCVHCFQVVIPRCTRLDLWNESSFSCASCFSPKRTPLEQQSWKSQRRRSTSSRQSLKCSCLLLTLANNSCSQGWLLHIWTVYENCNPALYLCDGAFKKKWPNMETLTSPLISKISVTRPDSVSHAHYLDVLPKISPAFSFKYSSEELMKWIFLFETPCIWRHAISASWLCPVLVHRLILSLPVALEVLVPSVVNHRSHGYSGNGAVCHRSGHHSVCGCSQTVRHSGAHVAGR